MMYRRRIAIGTMRNLKACSVVGTDDGAVVGRRIGCRRIGIGLMLGVTLRAQGER